ncbi:MAG: aminopeptidase P N-terminal domain-containing protein [Bacteroidetes bacterium]|nr:aminopeptidase P N-terminal domain-containing protein [Bacteroidota bacterium]
MYRLLFIVVIIRFSFSCLYAQEKVVNLSKQPNNNEALEYDTDLLPTSFFQNNRNELRKLMPPNSVAVLFANPVQNRSNDVDYQYHQDPNFYYLTGLREPNAMVIIFKDVQEYGSGLKTDEILFLQNRSKSDETWTGKRLGAERATAYLGIKTAMNIVDFIKFNLEFPTFDRILVSEIPTGIKNKFEKEGLYNLIQSFHLKTEKCKSTIDKNLISNQFLPKLRQTKQFEELVLLKKAIDITCDAQIELMKSLTSQLKEYQTQAVVEYVFKTNGAEYPGFPTIMGSGENSCVLHYTSNRKPLEKNDLLVSDIGAEYHGYTADVTRTLPVNGKFSEEQKIIYNIVLEAQKAGIQQCKKGNKFWDPHDAATNVIANQLMKWGIIDKVYRVKEYFMHGTSHYLGLDVHDAGLFGSLEPGNVITVEPGIYIPEGSNCDPKWWNIGVRIEDDILINDGETINISEKAPREMVDIEQLMKEVGVFEK